MDELKKGQKSVTSIDVAKRAGVSQSLVSRSFSGHFSVAKSTRERVLKAAIELGYQPNHIARSLITKRSNLISLVVGDISSPFYALVLKEVTHALEEKGYSAILASHAEGDIDRAIVDSLVYRPDGIFVLAGDPSRECLATCIAYKTPVVMFARSDVNTAASSVSCDNIGAARTVAELLIGRGLHNVVYFGSAQKASYDADRERGFIETLALKGVKGLVWRMDCDSYRNGYAGAIKLFKKKPQSNAVFCVSDITAIGVMDALRNELGLRVPEDVSVVGFDDIPMASWVSYNLTTIRQNTGEMAQAALSLVVENPNGSAQKLKIPGQLIHRGSVRT